MRPNVILDSFENPVIIRIDSRIRGNDEWGRYDK